MNETHAVFIEAGLGYGLYEFISSLISTVKHRIIKCIKIDMSEVISKGQVDDKVKTDSGHNLASLIYTLSVHNESVYFIIFDKIRSNIDAEAITYLLKLRDIFRVQNDNIFFVYSSSVNFKEFSFIHTKLSELSLHETGVILRNRFDENRFKTYEISKIHEYSEGVMKKLEQIMYFLEDSSTQEVLSQDDIFDDIFHSDSIPSITLKQIDILLNDPNKHLTLEMLKILSILKNGETLSNLRRDKMGNKFGPRNTKELIQLELATTIFIDSATTIIKINPIVKDYILSKMTVQEKHLIANAYLSVTFIESKTGIKLSSANRKIYDNGYNTEEDNANTLLKFAFDDCKSRLGTSNTPEGHEQYQRRMNKLLYLSESYIYGLCNSSRFNEAISSISSLIEYIREIDKDNLYKYYYHIAYAWRMKSNHDEAKKYLALSKDLCPPEDKETQRSIYTEELYILEREDPMKAIGLARTRKNEFKSDTAAYILSDVMLSLNKEKGERIAVLEKQEKKARRLGYHTAANNILFTLNSEKNNSDQLNSLNTVIKTDTSPYNICRATIYKNEALIKNGDIDKITENDFQRLINIYNYLFRQKFDSLFNKCHHILWTIAEYKKNNDLIIFIFYKGTIVWKLNADTENETKYNKLISRVETLSNAMLLGNVYDHEE